MLPSPSPSPSARVVPEVALGGISWDCGRAIDWMLPRTLARVQGRGAQIARYGAGVRHRDPGRNARQIEPYGCAQTEPMITERRPIVVVRCPDRRFRFPGTES